MARRIAVDLTVLRESRDLRRLIGGEVFSGLGTQAALVAIPFQVYTLTRSAALVGLVGAVELLPLVTGSLIGGAVADRADRRRMLLAAQAMVACVAAGLAAVSLLGRPSVAVVLLLAAALAGLGGRERHAHGDRPRVGRRPAAVRPVDQLRRQPRASRDDGRRPRRLGSAPMPELLTVLRYDYVADVLERRPPHREAHLALIGRWQADGRLLMGGPLGDPPHGALFVLRTPEAAAAEAFVREDPYVGAGLVDGWHVDSWSVIT